MTESPSRLSSILVRDGIVGVKRLEQAFQRQVIYGGALDTNLLEIGAISDDQVNEYLALASGIPSATHESLDYFDPRAVQICPREVAEGFRVVPLSFENEALRVLTMEPVDFQALEALATQLMTPVQPFVVPEYRFTLLMDRMFGVTAPQRHLALAGKLAAAQRPAPPSTKVIVEELADAPSSPMPERKATTAVMSTDAVMAVVEMREQQRRANTMARTAVSEQVELPTISEPSPEKPSPTSEAITPRLPRGQQQALTEQSAVVRSPWRGHAQPFDPRPLEPQAATDILSHADERDVAFSALVRGVRARTRYAAVLVVQGEIAYGRVAIDGDLADSGVVQVAIPVGRVAAFDTAVSSRAPYVGVVATHDPVIDALISRLGGLVPPSALVLPIAIRERTVAFVYAHRGRKPVNLSDIAEVLPLASAASSALSRLILRAKSEGHKKERAASPGPPVGEPPPQTRPVTDGGWRRAAVADAVPVNLDLEASRARPSLQPIDTVLDTIEAGGAGSAAAVEEAVARAEEVVPRLRRRLPGKLWIDRYAASARPARASQHGPLLALAVRLGERVAPLLAELLASDSRELRFYATLACCEVRSPMLTLALVTRLHDFDHGVRAAAIDALVGYPRGEIEGALGVIREGLLGEPAFARAAAHALGELRDVAGIPRLIDATDRDHGTAEEARRALVAITKQDFGTRSRKWKAWWEKNRARSRVEWLLDGLAHAEDDLRLAASEELKRMTGEYFGYHYDLPRREREEARAKWLKWWEETGRARFSLR